ncbi:MAG: YeeE/YedE family protein [Tepidanaerobacteraceae bacterium]|nr:YeeE/YedE family protein [Tepidanaerobacteraceae bacterium]
MSNEIDALVRKRCGPEKVNKKSQISYAVIILIIASIISVILWINNHVYAAFWIIGIALGMVLRYSRFCFASAFRDPFLIKNTKLMRALLLSFMVSTIGFAVIQNVYLNHNAIDYALIPGAVFPVGLHTAIGAFIFGIGMTNAGGCASGVLMRIGEGHVLPWITLLGFFIGTTLGAKDYSFWYDKIISKANVFYFPEHINLGVVVMVQMAVLIGLYKLAAWYQKKNGRIEDYEGRILWR